MFVAGLFLIDAPASALNNGQGEDTRGKVKSIHVWGPQGIGGDYPYVSAQSFRYWFRRTLERNYPEWKSSPVYTAGQGQRQQAFTEGDPITYWDDDLLGYMRAEKNETITRVSPFRTSTLVSVSPVQLIDDFGVMARAKKAEGDKEGVLLHSHEFYRTTLQGLFSLDLAAVGTFTNERRSGYQNLGQATLALAKEKNLIYHEETSTFRLPSEERITRVQTVLRALGRLEGGAKQTLHYTDVSPVFVLAAVIKSGNNPFGHVVTGTGGVPSLNAKALKQALEVFGSEFLSRIYVGRVEGFMDSAAPALAEMGFTVQHPREALDDLANDLAQHPEWLE